MDVIVINGSYYYYYDTYDNIKQALKTAKYKKKQNKKCKYHIITTEQGLMFKYKTHRLYLTKFFTIKIF